MTTGIATSYFPSGSAEHPHVKAAWIVFMSAGYDLMLATLIIVAGSQGIYRFAPPLLLWVMVYAMVGLKFAANSRGLLSAVRGDVAVLAFPAIAFLSAVWSLAPSHSAYSAVQLTVTYLAGFWIGWRYRPKEIAVVIVLGLSPLIALSLLNWATGMFGEVYAYSGGLLGIFGNKNTLGRMSLLLGVAALGLLLAGPIRPRRAAILVGILAMAALALVLSKSATSAIFMFGAAALLIVLTMHRYRAEVRLAIIVAGTVAFLTGCALIAFGNLAPVDKVLEMFGKSSNLTGRTFLWDIALHQISLQPWLGVGFDAYWDSNAFRAADRIQLIFGDGLISFHNFVLDIWVGLGIPGLIAITVTLGTILIRYLRYYLAGRSVEAALMLALFTAAIGVALFNPLLHGQHGNMIVILVAFAVSARIETRRDRAPRAGGKMGPAR